jgi:hypothetical protein
MASPAASKDGPENRVASRCVILGASAIGRANGIIAMPASLRRRLQGSVQKVLQKKEVMVRGWISKPQPSGCCLRSDHAPHDTEMLAKPAAYRLAERTPDEEQREAQTDDRSRSTSGVQKKRQEQQIAHPGRRIERADDEEKTEAAAVSPLSGGFVLGRRGERLSRHESPQGDADSQSNEGHDCDNRPPCEDRQQQGYGRGESRFPKIAGEIIDAERPP